MENNMCKKVLVVVDYQNDFASPNGALYVPNAETISKNIQHQIDSDFYDTIIYTMDSHNPEEYSVSAEAEMFPPHCIYGTNGWNFFEIEPKNSDLKSLMMKNRTPKDVHIGNEFVFVKDVFDVWASNSNYAKFINSFDKDTEFYICGVATNYCVFSNAMGYKDIGYENVFILSDSVKGIFDDSYETAIDSMIESNIKFKGGISDVCKFC
jgi:nicotinamidase-related amidase